MSAILEFSDDVYTDLLLLIKERYGFDFTSYSIASFQRRIRRYMGNMKISNVQELKDYLSLDQLHFNNFLLEITVNVTEMFRDPGFFKELRAKVVPQLDTYPHIRIWDAGCSTGEEVYSLAILFKEEGILKKTRIYATDINQKVINEALEGIFPLAYMKDYSKNYIHAGGHTSLSDYYFARYNNAIMNEQLKANVTYSTHNLVSDASFNEFHLIVCRNVLIYFQKELQERVIGKFLECLPVFGYLVLGNKESLSTSKYRKNFEVIDSKEKIYRRIS
ncbi:MAG: protein-glutamate O-methyltransferase CheR [Opitutaceae bacterium]|nr:protein-glutamate O-methyltransferase CheR [Cytophagales bacterium]